MICVSISEPGQIRPLVQAGAELIELRLDLLRISPAVIYDQLPGDIKTVVTCRPGGYTEKERIRLIRESVELGASYVDLELESSGDFADQVISLTADHGCEVIFSYHNFEVTPGKDELKQLLERCFLRGGDVAKIATTVNKRTDIFNLVSLYELPGRKVVLGMGDAGRITRVVGPYLGAEFTFASPGSGYETAPGQLNAAQLQAIFKVLDQS
ncbi:MAG: type I 3-dehydroquinate dehydratase [Bacteroidota bacterium]